MEKDHRLNFINSDIGGTPKESAVVLDELAYIINKTPTCIKVFDRMGRMVFINQTGADEHFLKTPEQAAHWDYLSSVDPLYIELVKQNMTAVFGGEVREVEFKHVPGTSTHEWCHGYLLPLKNAQNEIIGVLFSSIDASEQKMLAEKITRLEGAKQEFISVAAHQLRTPIATLRGYSELLLGESEKLTKEQSEFVKSIFDIACNMNDLVNFLLRIIRVEIGDTKMTPVPLDLSILTDEVVQMAQSDLVKGQVIKITQSPNPFPKVTVDRDSAMQVIQNLILNASRYSPAGSVINISLVVKDGKVQYSVEDKGIGISENEKGRIFEKFYRAENAKAVISDGTGLGLSFAKSLVEAWGGNIWFESEENKGTTFYVTIPLGE